MKFALVHKNRALVAITVVMVLVSALVNVLNITEQVSPKLKKELQEIRMDKTRAAVALSALQESDNLEQIQIDTERSVEQLTLRLFEVLSKISANNLMTITESTITKTNRADTYVANTEHALHSLSVTISANAREADVLLVVTEQLKIAAQWRPVEPRSCSFHKTDLQNKVHFTCLIDVYYFPRLVS